MEIQNSAFMADCSTNDKGKEVILSFQMSFVLRTAADENIAKEKPVLFNQCRRILFMLLGKNRKGSSIVVKQLKVWKEWNNIDVLANVFITRDGQEERHVLLIENKVYTKMTEKQRDEYPLILRKEYNQYKDWPDGYTLHQCVISCGEEELLTELRQFCEGTDWRVYSFFDLVDWDKDELTESEIFNQFWYCRWDPIPE